MRPPTAPPMRAKIAPPKKKTNSNTPATKPMKTPKGPKNAVPIIVTIIVSNTAPVIPERNPANPPLPGPPPAITPATNPAINGPITGNQNKAIINKNPTITPTIKFPLPPK